MRNGCFWCEPSTSRAFPRQLKPTQCTRPTGCSVRLVPTQPSRPTTLGPVAPLLPSNWLILCRRPGWDQCHPPMVVPAGLPATYPAPPATVTDRLEAGSETIPLECPGQPAEDARGWWQLQRNLHQTLFTNSHVTYSATIGGVLRPTSSEGGRIQSRVKRGDSKRHVLGVELQRSV